uniref:F-box domain-containing protein n=2 Tax=Oryza meridionalis TaxID=40149 RepID=A0A0E0CHD4_9ORYZ
MLYYLLCFSRRGLADRLSREKPIILRPASHFAAGRRDASAPEFARRRRVDRGDLHPATPASAAPAASPRFARWRDMQMQFVTCHQAMEDNNDEIFDGQNEAVQSQVSLPQDIQRIIIGFLPGRTVLKFCSVCKFWRDCIVEPAFVDHHLNCALRFRQAIACFTSVDNGLIQMYMFDPITVNFKRTEPVFSSRFHMSQPCNGMVCAYDLKGAAEVLNPTTRKHLTLPASESVYQAQYSEYFLGYVHSTKEYKVVALRHWIKHLTFEVCTIGTLSWRTVRGSEEEELLKTTKPVVVNDEMHWLLLDDESSYFTRKILSFNLTDEKFSYLDVPDSVRDRDLELVEGEGKLHLWSMPCKGAAYTESEIWLADSTRQFWVHLHNIAHPSVLGTKPFFMYKSKLFLGSQKRFIYIDILDGTVCYVDIPSGENIISSGMHRLGELNDIINRFSLCWVIIKRLWTIFSCCWIFLNKNSTFTRCHQVVLSSCAILQAGEENNKLSVEDVYRRHKQDSAGAMK